MIEIEVTYNDHSQGYFPIDQRQGWRVNPAQRCLVIGHGVPRIHVPLDNVLYFTLLEKPDPETIPMSPDEVAAFFEDKMGRPPICSGCGRPAGVS